MAADIWTGSEPLPASEDEVEVIVMPYDVPDTVIAKIAKFPRLRYVQTLSAGTETLAAALPDGVVLCNGRGARRVHLRVGAHGDRRPAARPVRVRPGPAS